MIEGPSDDTIPSLDSHAALRRLAYSGLPLGLLLALGLAAIGGGWTLRSKAASPRPA